MLCCFARFFAHFIDKRHDGNHSYVHLNVFFFVSAAIINNVQRFVTAGQSQSEFAAAPVRSTLALETQSKRYMARHSRKHGTGCGCTRLAFVSYANIVTIFFPFLYGAPSIGPAP